ncbi:bifunctional folylpolyglutamate synthase/dihydrofolate synthase [Hansschlegelia zhihuaiae]|uniref:Dihydrofolate synthase/folylpolyglutamate synthase n=1 Tax=Hansschlegelia zhihuaiae TaxID=405005 RepID=A0A4Q0MH45_9HYPH|nr:folylpolyglutamate synthase/dihydrofolate synthase family protein [Hansschlegelia zhihuaiae]RXF72705.1 bifunctional folylpolyglutamate synthase/dihydrofolate synthase [Hansschlegelia zhihuaiae]
MDGSDAYLDRFLALHPKEIDLSLGRIERLLKDLGHPERAMPPVVQVAGTNGKGSSAAFMRAMLEAAGRRVHVYTSPHLVRFHERIRLGGRFVDEDRLAATFEEVERVNDGRQITLFEITTAAAMLLFAREPADLLLLEVGLGGRYDATNVVEKPLASVITPVSLDHQKFLGDDLGAIAHEKAGILKSLVPAVIARQDAAALESIEREAAKVGAPLSISGQDWQAREERGRLVFEDGDGLLDLPLPRLVGRHQIENAGAAIATLRAVERLNVETRAIEVGLSSVDWPARMQRLSSGRLPTLLPTGAELWLDGGHNPDGGRAIASTMAELDERSPKPIVLVVGMLNTKDSDGFLEAFAGLAGRLYGVPIGSSTAARAPDEVVAAAERAGLAAEACGSIEEALAKASRAAGPVPPRVLITGSLYLAGEALAANGTPPG